MGNTEGGKTDGASLDIVARELKACCESWDPNARLLGNIRAHDIRRLCVGMLEMQRVLRGDFEYYQNLAAEHENTENGRKFGYKMMSLRDTLKAFEKIYKE